MIMLHFYLSPTSGDIEGSLVIFHHTYIIEYVLVERNT